MSVTFWVRNSPQHMVTRTWGEEGDGETDITEEDVLPTCNFSNGAANAVCALVGYNLEAMNWGGCWEHSELPDILDNLVSRITNHGQYAVDVERLLRLYVVVAAANLFGEAVCFG